MSHKIKTLTLAISVFVFVFSANAQRWHSNLTNEVGVAIGASSFMTDYGQRHDLKSGVARNGGIGVGFLYYLTFTNYRYAWNQRTTYFAEHFRLRNELSYHNSKFEHYGKWVDHAIGVNGDKLKAMHGKTEVWHLGTAMEFHFVNIHDFGTRRDPDLIWAPYVSFGVGVDFYNPSIYTRYGNGDWKGNNLLYTKWDSSSAARDSKGKTMSISLAAGTRLKIGEYSDIFIEGRGSYYFSDWIEGLNARNDQANKYNDWSMWLHVGYIYYLN